MSSPPSHNSDDPWTLQPGSSAEAQPEPDLPTLQIETIEGVEPLDTQIGVFPKKTVPAERHNALCDQPEPTAAEIEAAGGDPAAVPPMQTYAILDAAKLTNLPELLERSGLEHCCLFKGNAFDELKNVAPWIVQLEEGDAFTRNLFTRSDAHWHLWDKEPGVYVRSRGILDELLAHYRRFVRVRREDGSWNYFRLWDAAIMLTHYEYLAGQPKEVPRWFCMRTGNYIHALLAVQAHGDCHRILVTDRSPVDCAGSFTLKEAEVRAFRQARLQRSKADISKRLRKHMPEFGDAEVSAAIDGIIRRFSAYGFRSKASIFSLTWWELKYGPTFERHLDEVSMRHLTERSSDEGLRISDVRMVLDGKKWRTS